MRATTRLHDHSNANLSRGVAAGLLGGLVGSWVMNSFQTTVPAEVFKKLLGEAQGPPDSASGSDDSSEGSESGASEGGSSEPATVKVAEALSEGLVGHELTDREKQWAGPAVHYGFGSMNGAVYGALAEVEPRVTAGAGLPFGAAVWLAADEAAVAALGFSKAPWRYPAFTHVYAFTSHLVFGLTVELTRRLVRRLL